MADVLNIPFKAKGRKKKGDDGYKYTSIRLRDEMFAELDRLAAQSNRSRNEIITIMIEYGIKNAKITGK